MSEAYLLTEDGDLDISSNGVMRLTQTIDQATWQSAYILTSVIKGSYPLIPELGLDYNVVFNYDIPGKSSTESIEEILEYLMRMEVKKDPFITDAIDFKFVKDGRSLNIEFTIVTNTGSSVVSQGITI